MTKDEKVEELNATIAALHRENNRLNKVWCNLMVRVSELTELYRVGDIEKAVLQAKVEELEDVAFRRGAMFDSPCFLCGYQSYEYFNPTFHPCAARHHELYDQH